MKNTLYWLVLPAILLLMWLLLNNSVSPGHLVTGAVLALLLAWAAMALRPVRSRPKRPWAMLKLFWRVAVDITHSNFIVARLIILGPDSHTPGFMKIPLSMTDPHARAALACIITYTPGTVWSGYSEETNTLTLHVLDLKDETHWVELVQNRYQSLLLEIFE
ncbi:MAG TPA: Na+/H+ antiporter subunit E [Pusillimonas sp.]|uniref:Na+/H+ antiporter subunit E n=1 Tax=Pusillimonas sp. TaxID=3040095 RepID=UPI002C840410|nr:Na+/H+ antiporter subunit E [Pusillimonas sp.]HUH87082.1 Na+/H+ antiporter subunit E [Pusillimonas sp.]